MASAGTLRKRTTTNDPHPILEPSAATGHVLFPGDHEYVQDSRLRLTSSLPLELCTEEDGETFEQSCSSEDDDELSLVSTTETLSEKQWLRVARQQAKDVAAQGARSNNSTSSSAGYESGWISSEEAETKLREFIHKHPQAAAAAAPQSSMSVVTTSLDSKRGLISVSREQLHLLEITSKLPISRLEFFGCGQIAHEVQWSFLETSGTKQESPQAICILLQSPSSFVHDIGLCARLDLGGSNNSSFAYFDRNEDRIERSLLRITAPRGEGAEPSGQYHFWRWIFALLADYQRGADNWRILLERQVRRMEGETAARSNLLESGRGEHHNFGQLTISMQNAHVSHVALQRVAAWQEELWGFLGEMVGLAEELSKEVGGAGRSGTMTRREKDTLLRECGDRRRAAASRRGQMEAVQRRMQAQIGVLYSLISQRDSKVNIELSRDMRSTAAAAKKDSKVMKVIAALTLVFLPATMVSSIFSTGIFNVGFVDASNPRVSEFWWVFVLTSFVLTGIVLFFGYVSLREDLSLTLPTSCSRERKT